MAMYDDLLQANDLSKVAQENILKHFCDLWQDQEAEKTDDCQPEPNKQEYWKRLQTRCERSDETYSETEKWRNYLSDHLPAIKAYDKAIVAAEKKN